MIQSELKRRAMAVALPFVWHSMTSNLPRLSNTAPARGISLTLAALFIFSATGCSVRRYAIGKLGDALASSGTTFSADDDPELVRDALPFSLKLIESLLAETPRHRGLLLAAASGFTQFAYAFVGQDADEMEDGDTKRAAELRTRARKLYLRARGYGLRGLEVQMPGFEAPLRGDAKAAVRRAGPRDVPGLYWTALAWGAAIAISKERPDLVADQPLVEALIDRALELDEDFDSGAIHAFLVTYEMSRVGGTGGAEARARRHFERAMSLSGGRLAAPLVSLAEAVSVAKQDRKEFIDLLQRAVAVDADARPEFRLSNLVMQRRARWLLSRVDELFVE
jgi:predicted anti-sigma-YlaC factor YlaD